MDAEVRAVVQRLSRAVFTIQSGEASQSERSEAYQILEDFKDTSTPLSVIDCGFFMAQCINHDFERHFGLQLLENVVKFKWPELDRDQKFYIMDNVMKLMAEGTKEILVEVMFIKDYILLKAYKS